MISNINLRPLQFGKARAARHIMGRMGPRPGSLGVSVWYPLLVAVAWASRAPVHAATTFTLDESRYSRVAHVSSDAELKVELAGVAASPGGAIVVTKSLQLSAGWTVQGAEIAGEVTLVGNETRCDTPPTLMN